VSATEQMSVRPARGLSRIKLLLALSRTHHGLIDLATPGLGALLWLGAFPPPATMAIGLIAAFAGYTAVYALNDLVDYVPDHEKIRQTGAWTDAKGLDSVYVRHPLAHDLLTLREGVMWVTAWALLALVGAYALNPICAAIFLLSCLCETVYCLFLRVSFLRILLSGVVKTAGGIAAILAVDPDPSVLFVLTFFAWIFFWEVGGQNIPSDWADVEEDRALKARTVPVELGFSRARVVVMCALLIAVGLSVALFWCTVAALHPVYVLGALSAGVTVLLVPAYRLYRTESAQAAADLFSRASYYPLAMLLVVLISAYV
jgi:4-hydroxybenzoate polyprenyltransferase